MVLALAWCGVSGVNWEVVKDKSVLSILVDEVFVKVRRLEIVLSVVFEIKQSVATSARDTSAENRHCNIVVKML